MASDLSLPSEPGQLPTEDILQAVTAAEPASVDVSVVIPCLNEAETLRACIEKRARCANTRAASVRWSSQSRKREPDYSRTKRRVIPGATLAVLGFQTVLWGLFTSMLACGALEQASDASSSTRSPSSPWSTRSLMSSPPSSRASLAVALVALSGALCLAMPFWGDQALFTVYARQLTQGAVLYRDVFDVKQPGIFLFYALGGSLSGYTEVGIHLFELAYWLAFSVFALVALRPYFTTRWGASLVPVCTVVIYYLYAEAVDLTQIEALVAFPIVVAWWLIDRAEPDTRRGRWSYAAAGFAAAAVVLLKYLYVLVILAFLGYAALRSRRRIPIRDVSIALGAFLTALLVPLAVVVAYFAAQGQLERIWWAYFEMAPAAQLAGTKSLMHLKLGARRFMIGHAPILILAVLGCVQGLRQQAGPRRHLVAGMVLWGAAAAVAFVVQNWGLYKWLLFTAPLGILAVVGVEALVSLAGRSAKTPRRLAFTAGTALAVLSFMAGAPVPQVQTQLLWSVVIGVAAGIGAELLATSSRARRGLLLVLSAALAVSVGLAAIVPAHKLRVLMEHGFALTADARTTFQRYSYDSYRAADDDLEVLRRRKALPGPIYVFGDPVLLLRANRPQAVPIPGWVTEFLDSRAWQELDSDLRSTLPPYIIIDGYSESMIHRRCPAILEFIESRYKVAFVGASGTWYALR
jgi:hypothetical protein